MQKKERNTQIRAKTGRNSTLKRLFQRKKKKRKNAQIRAQKSTQHNTTKTMPRKKELHKLEPKKHLTLP